MSQAARSLRLGSQILVAQKGICAELTASCLPEWINGLRLTRLRRWCRVAIDDARVERTLSDDGQRAVWRGSPVEAGRKAMVTNGADLAHQKQEAALLTIDADLLDELLVPRCLSLSPERVAAAAPVMRPARLVSQAKGIIV